MSVRCLAIFDAKDRYMCRGRYIGHEAPRLALLKYAAMLEPAYVDIEHLAADFFFAGDLATFPVFAFSFKGAKQASLKRYLGQYDVRTPHLIIEIHQVEHL